MGFLLLKVFVAQVIAACIVVFILKLILDKILVDNAIRKIETINPKKIDQTLKDISVITYKPLDEPTQQRILDALFKKLKRTTRLLITQDKRLKSGIIIKLNDEILDYSLAGRLKEGGVIKRK